MKKFILIILCYFLLCGSAEAETLSGAGNQSVSFTGSYFGGHSDFDCSNCGRHITLVSSYKTNNYSAIYKDGLYYACNGSVYNGNYNALCVTEKGPRVYRNCVFTSMGGENVNVEYSPASCISGRPYHGYWGSVTIAMSGTAIINGGSYTGTPAISSTSITVNKGTIKDLNNCQSTFLLGEDSEQTVVTNNGQTITTVKLSNPPVIIDWADFPG